MSCFKRCNCRLVLIVSALNCISAYVANPMNCHGYLPVSVTFKKHWYPPERTKDWMLYIEQDLMYKLKLGFHHLIFNLNKLVKLKYEHNDHIDSLMLKKYEHEMDLYNVKGDNLTQEHVLTTLMGLYIHLIHNGLLVFSHHYALFQINYF